MNKPTKQIKQKHIDKVFKLYKSNKFNSAKKEAIKLLLIDENNLNILRLLISLSDVLHEMKEKKDYLLKVIAIDKNDYNAYNDLSLIYNEEGNYLKAEEMCLKMLELAPKSVVSHTALAGLYSENKKYDKAAKIFKNGMLLNPDNVDLPYLYSTSCLINRLYKEGFDLYRYRYHDKRENRQTKLIFSEEVLLKNLDVKDKIVLFTDDQGYGDMIQFMRYLPLFEEKGAKVYFKVHKLLSRLFEKNYPKYIIREKDLKIDYHLPMMDAAYLFGTEYETIPFQDKYLSVDKNDSKIIHDKYFKGVVKKKIGIIWRSNIRDGEISIKQKSRQNASCTLEDFITFFNSDEVQLYSMQHSATEQEKALLKKNNILSLGDNLVDFYDNALRIDNLDAVIGIETASILIAGAMGKETVVLLTDKPYWIWGADGEKTNWFSSIKIIRKEKNEEWGKILEKISKIDGLLKDVNTTKNVMKEAIEYHQDAKLEDAEKLYREVLANEPENADAYHYLGLIAFQTGHTQQAVALIQQAIKLNPNLDEAYVNLQKILRSKNTQG